MSLIDFKLDGYDYLTFFIGVLAVIAFFYVMITLGGLPGKLAEKRKHPHADSVKLGGWIGLFTVFPWIHALMWAYHDSLTIDIRKLPKESQIKPGPAGDSGAVGDGPEVAPILMARTDEQSSGIAAAPAKSGGPEGVA